MVIGSRNRISVIGLLVGSLVVSACGTTGASAPAGTAPAGSAGTPSAAAGPPTTLDELARYQGDDRTAILESCANEEGELIWVSELAGGVVTAMKEAFQAKYPGIAVSESRANGSEFVPRIQEERQAGRFTVDAFEMSSDTQLLLKSLDVHQPYWSPMLANYQDEDKEPAGDDGTVLQTVDRLSFAGFGYNTTLLPEADVPTSYADLLKPALAGKLVMSGDGSTGAQLFGVLSTTQAADYIEKLAAQDYTIQQVSGRGLLDLISAGEVAASPTIFKNHVLTDAANGAPVAWVPLEPVSANAGGSSVAKDAPHPCSALLFTDFILGPEGRAVLDSFFYGDPAADAGFEYVYPGAGMTPEEYDTNIRTWDALMRENAGS
jgi:iron(III) transport system substrate-binding protein